MRARGARAFGALALGLGMASANADPIDPTLPQRRVVGPPAGACPASRVDGGRTGRARSPLPNKPRELWRARITGGLDLFPVVDRAGHVVAASASGRVSELDARGKLVWTAKTGSASIVLGPVLTSDGTRVVVTTTPEIVGVGTDGGVKYRQLLPLSNLKGAAEPLATSDGGLVLAANGKLLRLDSRGGIQARADFTGTPVAALEQGARVLVATLSGDVLEWKPPAAPTRLGSFGGQLDEGAALSSPNHVTAVVDHQRVIDLNLSAGSRHVRLESSELIQGPPAILGSGETRVASFAGLMLGHDRTGAETSRVALEPPAVAGAALALGLAGAPPLVVDAKGRVAFARPGLDAGIVQPSGNVVTAPGAACGDPMALVPAGAKRMLLGCRSGLMLMIGD